MVIYLSDTYDVDISALSIQNIALGKATINTDIVELYNDISAVNRVVPLAQVNPAYADEVTTTAFSIG